MAKKKSHQGIAGHRRAGKRKPSRVAKVRIHGGGELLPESGGANGTQHEYQRLKNPYEAGEREKLLEKRAKLTLKAFRIAYENHHRS